MYKLRGFVKWLFSCIQTKQTKLTSTFQKFLHFREICIMILIQIFFLCKILVVKDQLGED